MNNKTWLISFRMCSIFQHSPNYSSCPWLVLATYSSANTRACWTVSSLVALTVSYMFNISGRAFRIYYVFQKLFMNYCHKLSLSNAVTRKFVGPDDEIHIWLEAPWHSLVLIRVSFLPSASTVCPPPAILLVRLGIRWEAMSTTLFDVISLTWHLPTWLAMSLHEEPAWAITS